MYNQIGYQKYKKIQQVGKNHLTFYRRKNMNISNNLDRISDRLSEDAFLSNRGLSNEVGIHVFCYDPEDEITVRGYFNDLKEKKGVPFNLIECDL